MIMRSVNKAAQGKTRTPKRNRIFYFFIAVVVLLLAWIVNKDIGVPSWLIINCGIVVAIFLLLKGMNNPEVPFYVLVAYLPFNKVLAGTFGGFMTALNLTNIFLLITLFCWVINRMFARKSIFQNNGLNWLILLLCLFGIFSVVRGGLYYGSRYFVEFIFPLKRWLTPLFLYFLAINIVRNKTIFKNTIVIIMIVVAVAGLLAVKQGLDVGDAGSLDSSRVGGLAEQPNMMGGFFVYYMFLYLGFFMLYWRNFKYWGLLLPFLACFRGIQYTFSRGAFLGFGIGLAGVAFFRNKWLFLLLCFGAFLAVLNPQILPGSLRYAVERTSSGQYDSFSEGLPLEEAVDPSAGRRIEIWKGALEIIKDNPWWGVGYGVFPYAIPYYVNLGEVDAHNTYLLIAAEMGIPVLLLFLLIIFVVFKNTFWLFRRVEDQFIKATALGMLGGLSGALVVNMFGSRFESEEVSAYFWILAGLIVRAVIMKKRKEIM